MPPPSFPQMHEFGGGFDALFNALPQPSVEPPLLPQEFGFVGSGGASGSGSGCGVGCIGGGGNGFGVDERSRGGDLRGACDARVAGAAGTAGPVAQPVGMGGASGPGGDAYFMKLAELMRKLEDKRVLPHMAVQGVWAQLHPAERIRFEAEFPQFMCYVAAAPAVRVPTHAIEAPAMPVLVPPAVSAAAASAIAAATAVFGTPATQNPSRTTRMPRIAAPRVLAPKAPGFAVPVTAQVPPRWQ